MERIRLMIVDDYAPIRLGLRAIFESEEDIEVVGDYGDGESAIEDAGEVMPNVVLMDVRMPGMDGVEACRLMRDRVPGANVVMLTSFDDERAATASILAGARGFLLKNGGSGELLHAVRVAVRGETLLDPALAGRVVDSLTSLASAGQPVQESDAVPSGDDC
ncbi:MAG: response regulator transcription factor [Chloroflexota bacterium]|nr:response regulator transcription factor [Chloroflexota bacterium]